MKIESVIVTVKVDSKNKTFKPSATIIDDMFHYEGRKVIAMDDDEKIEGTKRPGKGIKLRDIIPADVILQVKAIEQLIAWDDRLHHRYGGGIVYAANYGVDLQERGKIQQENKIPQRKLTPLDWLAEQTQERQMEIMTAAINRKVKLEEVAKAEMAIAQQTDVTA